MSSLQELRERIETMPADQLPELVGELARMQAMVMARLCTPEAPRRTPREANLLTAADVAARLNVNVQRAYELLRNGTLPAVRIGRQVRTASADLEKWIREGGNG